MAEDLIEMTAMGSGITTPQPVTVHPLSPELGTNASNPLLGIRTSSARRPAVPFVSGGMLDQQMTSTSVGTDTPASRSLAARFPIGGADPFNITQANSSTQTPLAGFNNISNFVQGSGLLTGAAGFGIGAIGSVVSSAITANASQKNAALTNQAANRQIDTQNATLDFNKEQWKKSWDATKQAGLLSPDQFSQTSSGISRPSSMGSGRGYGMRSTPQSIWY